ncbi:MAG: sensor domain-containing diguanylate cyclase [Patescibacteria group bacterium]
MPRDQKKKVARLKKEVQFWRSFWLNTSEAVVFTDLESRILFANPAAENFFGYTFEDMQGKNILDFANGAREEIDRELAELSQNGTLKNLRLFLRTRHHESAPVSLTVDIISEGKTRRGILWIIQDLSVIAALEAELKKTIAQLERETKIDYLTQIFNRRHFERHLDYEVKRAERYGHELALLFLDVDDFKKGINDKYGHPVGDKVLKAIVAALTKQVRETDFLARWGGEEFVVICPETGKEGAIMLAEKIREVIEESEFSTDEEILRITVSIGVANFIPNGTKEGLVKKANNAMHYAKSSGRNRVWHASWPIDRDVA